MVKRRIIRKDGIIQKYNVKKERIEKYYHKTKYGLFSVKLANQYQIVRKISNRKVELKKIVQYTIDRTIIKEYNIDKIDYKTFQIPQRKALEFIFNINTTIKRDSYFADRVKELENKINNILERIKKLWLDKRMQFLEVRYATILAYISEYNIFLRTRIITRIDEKGFLKFKQLIYKYLEILINKLLIDYPDLELYVDKLVLIFSTKIHRIEKFAKEKKLIIEI
jgi:hypothetical protein